MISGRDAWLALFDGKDVEYLALSGTIWGDLKLDDWEINDLKSDLYKFRLKPQTITINGVEVPAPFEPIDGEECCYITDESIDGYHTVSYNSERYSSVFFGLYRPSDIKQVVLALKQAIHTNP